MAKEKTAVEKLRILVIPSSMISTSQIYYHNIQTDAIKELADENKDLNKRLKKLEGPPPLFCVCQQCPPATVQNMSDPTWKPTANDLNLIQKDNARLKKVIEEVLKRDWIEMGELKSILRAALSEKVEGEDG